MSGNAQVFVVMSWHAGHPLVRILEGAFEAGMAAASKAMSAIQSAIQT